MVRKKTPLTVVGSTSTDATPARTLGPAGKSMWDAVMSEYQIDDIGGTAILQQICFAKDRIEQCVTQIEADGCVIYTKNGPKAHPLLRDELALRSFICRGLTRLGLNIESIKPVGRPGIGVGWRGE